MRMNTFDSILLVVGMIIPLVILQVIFSAGLVGLIIIVGCLVYCKIQKAHMINTHPDKQLLEEIRRQYY